MADKRNWSISDVFAGLVGLATASGTVRAEVPHTRPQTDPMPMCFKLIANATTMASMLTFAQRCNFLSYESIENYYINS